MQVLTIQHRSLCGALHIARVMPICVQKAGSYNSTPVAVWCTLHIAGVMPICVQKAGGGLCVSASIGWCRTQDNILSYSTPVIFTLPAFFFLFFVQKAGFDNPVPGRNVVLCTLHFAGDMPLRTMC